MRSRKMLISLLVLACAIPAAAQETTGNLQGRVLDEAGNSVPYANVVARGPSLQGSRGVMCRDDGSFSLLELPVGVYTITISHISFQEVTLEDVRIHLGRTTGLGRIELAERVHEMEAVVIRAERPLIEPTSTFLGANLADTDFENLPLERDYREVATLLPHAEESYLGDGVNCAGATGLDNRYFIDGVDVTDPFTGLTGTSLPHNFVREVQVRTGGYEAEYRSSLGGVINAITYSGGNEFSGQVFGFYVSDEFTGSRRAPLHERTTGGYAFYDVGAGIGGPIVRDKLWFYAGYNPTVVREDLEIPGYGVYQDKAVTHRFAGKLTWQADQRNNLVLTVFGDPTYRDGVGVGGTPMLDSLTTPDIWLTDVESGGVNASLRGTHALSDRWMLASTLSLVNRSEKNVAVTGDPMDPIVFDYETGIVSGNPGGYIDRPSRQTTAELDATFLPERHTIKGGLAYRENRLSGGDGWYTIQRYAVDSWWMGRVEAQGTLRNRIPSAFLQDSWKMTERWTLNFGVRWDGLLIGDHNGDVGQKILDQWQPRAGFVFQPGEPGTQRIHGSYGRFYHELATNVSAMYYSGGSGTLGQCDHDPREGLEGCDVRGWSGITQPEIDLTGQHYDEFTLGYERTLGEFSKVGVRGVYRTLREALEDGTNPNTGWPWFGNPGSGELRDFPKAEREYSALEISFQRSPSSDSHVLASYVLSRNEGNYPGLYHSDGRYAYPNICGYFDDVAWMENSTGRLPNDRTHIFKLAASRRLGYGVSAGTSFSWASGTPLNEWARNFNGNLFLRQRGTNGRTPSIWRWDARFVYELPGQNRVRPRVTLDFLNIASQREPVVLDQVHYLDSGKTLENSDYMAPLAFQPPMAVRLGMEIAF